VVNVSLPVMQRELRVPVTSLAWVTNAYLISFGGLLLLAGRLGDLFGRRRVFLAGLTVFTAASAGCGLANSEAALIAARFLQGIGGALASAVILGIIVAMFPRPRDQARAIGVYGFIAAAGGSAGVLAGGVITQLLDWHWIFFINAPVGVLTIAATRRWVPAGPGTHRGGRVDAAGAVLVTAAVMLAVYGIVGPASRDGVLSAPAAVIFAAAVSCLAAFAVRELTAAQPLMPLRLLGSRTLATANAVAGLVVAAMYGTSFLAVLYMQRFLGFGSIATGVAFLPVTVLMAVLSLRYSERLMTRFGVPRMIVTGAGLLTIGLLLLARVPVHGAYLPDLLAPMALLGAGNGLAFPVLMSAAMSGIPPADAGVASGLINTSIQIAGALGLATLAAVSAAAAAGHTSPDALIHGYRAGFGLAAGMGLAAVLLSAAGLRARRQAAGQPPSRAAAIAGRR
jgi:EmrB/QacA subfamily drug resistance transporter